MKSWFQLVMAAGVAVAVAGCSSKQAPPAAQDGAAQNGSTHASDTGQQDCPECPVMLPIPEGSFVMGTSEEEGRAEGFDQPQAHEAPTRRVDVRAFTMGRTEVTRAQYAAFVAETKHPDPPGCTGLDDKGEFIYVEGVSYRNPPGVPQSSDEDPVICVSWADATAYAAWLADKTGKPYRLPSEAEWEYAARAGTTTARYWEVADPRDSACEYGSVSDLKLAAGLGLSDAPDNVFQCEDGFVFTAPVGRFRANAFGLHDMLGNVSEWVADCYHDSYAGAPTDGSEWKDDACKVTDGEVVRLARGGAFGTDPRKIRAAWRSFRAPAAIFHTGFRVALSAE